MLESGKIKRRIRAHQISGFKPNDTTIRVTEEEIFSTASEMHAQTITDSSDGISGENSEKLISLLEKIVPSEEEFG